MQDELRCSQKHLKEQLERQSADGAKNEDADAQRDRNFLLLTRENAQLRDLLGDADSKVGLILLAFHSRVCVLVSCNPPLPPPLPVSEMDVPEDRVLLSVRCEFAIYLFLEGVRSKREMGALMARNPKGVISRFKQIRVYCF